MQKDVGGTVAVQALRNCLTVRNPRPALEVVLAELATW